MQHNVARQFSSGDRKDQRFEDRCPVLVEAKFREHGSFRTEVYLLDLSCHGCRIESCLRIRRGQKILLTLKGMETRSAIVRWAQNGAMGCQFEEPLHPTVVKHIATAHPGSHVSGEGGPSMN